MAPIELSVSMIGSSVVVATLTYALCGRLIDVVLRALWKHNRPSGAPAVKVSAGLG